MQGQSYRFAQRERSPHAEIEKCFRYGCWTEYEHIGYGLLLYRTLPRSIECYLPTKHRATEYMGVQYRGEFSCSAREEEKRLKSSLVYEVVKKRSSTCQTEAWERNAKNKKKNEPRLHNLQTGFV